jgi:hypothetical protein
VSSTPGSPDASAILDAESTTQGLLPPRMNTAQRDAIVSPAAGLRIFNTTSGCENYYNGVSWFEICGECTPKIAAPTAGTHAPSYTSITWNWNPVPGATGYRWSTEWSLSRNFNTATDIGNSTTITMNGLTSGTSYTLFVWAYDNGCGPSGNPVELTASTLTCAPGLLGPGGGYIFYCGNAYPGYTGLEAAPSDQSTGVVWGCNDQFLPGADVMSIGGGYQNTLDVVAECPDAGIAAKICDELELNGYDDWFLPSFYELYEMYQQLRVNDLGGFTDARYWSSSEEWSTTAGGTNFTDGNINGWSKNDSYRVRAVRRF